MSASQPRKPLSTTKTLPTKLSREERDDRARALAARTADKLRVTAEAKISAGEFKEMLKEIEEQIIKLMDATNNGVEDREVDCHIAINDNMAYITRCDTGELVETRPASKGEIRAFTAKVQTNIFEIEGVN